MYDLPYHKENRGEVVKSFIAQYPFAFLSGCDEHHSPVATQVPVFLEEEQGRMVLRGHIMKNTKHHKAFMQNEKVLVVFTGRHTYVSATWYSNPNQPSTWNYMSVHCMGNLKLLDDAALPDVLRKTSLHFENNNEKSSTAFGNLPKEFTERVMKAIVAFEIDVTGMDTVFKLSQDRDEESYRNIIARLKEQDEDGRVIAAEMEKRAGKLFPGA